MKAKASDVISYAMIDLGVDVVTHVPGYGGSETFLSYNSIAMKRYFTSFHEEPAYSIAHGSSIFGKRSAVLIKSHGLVKAANAASDSLYTQITAGFVVMIFEDFSGAHSDNILEIVPVLKGMSFPFHKAKIESLYDDVVAAYQMSESLKLPVALLIDAGKIEKEITFDRRNDLKKNFEYNRNILKHIVSPLFAEYQYQVFTAKKLQGDLTAIPSPKIPQIPDGLNESRKQAAIKYWDVFNVFKDYRGDAVTGDTSSSSYFCLPPYDSIDALTHIGGSIPLAIGAYLSGKRNVWAVSGDFGFIAAGHISLIEVVQRELPIKILIFNNKQAAATGGQPIHKSILLRLLAGYEKYVTHISDPHDPIEIRQVFKEVSAGDTMNIVIADY
ncbi:MAG: hypothetical protein K9J16_00905 [Melioribacteraceae bacterium]|nr:hypothetical protein [Melioribacteraceae bacterium]MCF8354034.1 hypothetical protein [Melioribacteraceae bacterium]MCF8392285.1 hypothetical protein [Melioribacteraceae bacterium]MCF8417617.1 hypothetical protein [Melioribacteraceae bacterium]